MEDFTFKKMIIEPIYCQKIVQSGFFKGSGILKYNNKYIQKLNNQIFLTEKYGYTLELKKRIFNFFILQ